MCDANAQAANTLNLVMRDEGTIKFVKYVSGQAPSSRWDVATVYEVDEDDSDEEEDEYDAVRLDACRRPYETPIALCLLLLTNFISALTLPRASPCSLSAPSRFLRLV